MTSIIPSALQKFQNKWNEGKFVCVGLDTEYSKLPKSIVENFKSRRDAILEFNKSIIDSTIDLTLCYKPNSAFYEGEGAEGLEALKKTVEYIKSKDDSLPIILDAKRADIGNTNRGYIKMAFEEFGFDAVTVNPYLGTDSLQPFLDEKDKLIIILCKTSNPSASEIQDLEISVEDSPKLQNITKNNHVKIYQFIAFLAKTKWNSNGNVGLVVGATYPEELSEIRKIAGDMPILIPGVGSQGGDVNASVKAGLDSKRQGIMVNSSRGIIYASSGPDFAESARKATQKLNEEIVLAIK